MTDQTETIDAASVDRTPALRPAHAVASPTTPPAEWGVIVAQAEVLARSQIIPFAYRNKPENIIAAAITGRQFGWDVMAAMRNTHVIEGTVAIKPEAQVGLVRAAGHSITGETSSTSATARGKRADTGDEMAVTFTIEDAEAAGLCKIVEGKVRARSNKGGILPWEAYTSSMLWVRAVSQLCRMLFADVTLGLSYTPDELDRGDSAVPDFSGDVADPNAEAPTPAPPDGWESWDECQAAHDALKAAVAAAEAQARNQWQGYLKDSGYKPWFTKAQHDELAAQLEILNGAPTERVATTIPEAEVVTETVGADAEPVSLPADEASAPTPSAENGDQDGATLSLLDGTAVPAPDESGVGEAGGAPAPAPGSQSPAPGGEPMNPGLRNRIGAYSTELGIDRDTRLAICTFVAQRDVTTMNDLTKNEGEWVATALRLMKNGHLAWDADTAQVGAIDPTDGMADDPTRLPGVKFMQDFAALHGFEYDLGETTDQEA